jgi:hypothetical protein
VRSRETVKPCLKQLKLLGTNPRRQAFVKLLGTDPGRQAVAKLLGTDPSLGGFLNKSFDLITRERPHRVK